MRVYEEFFNRLLTKDGYGGMSFNIPRLWGRDVLSIFQYILWGMFFHRQEGNSSSCAIFRPLLTG